MSVIKSGKTIDVVLGAYARNINMLAALFDIDLKLVHFPGMCNTVADLLSRWDTVNKPQEKLQEIIINPQCVPVCLDMLHINWTI